MVWMFASILGVKGTNFTNDVFMVNSDKLIKYFPLLFFRIGAYLG
jgi:hypothetical protein